MSEYKSIKEWIISCATSTDRKHVGPGRLICPSCVCAYAREVGVAALENAAREWVLAHGYDKYEVTSFLRELEVKTP